MSCAQEKLTNGLKQEFQSMIDTSHLQNIAVITDIPLASKCRWIYRKQGVRVHQFDKDMMINRHPSFFNTKDVDILWLDVSQRKCREWIQQNYTELHSEWFVVSVYDIFDDWIYEVESKSTISFFQFDKLEHAELDQLYEMILSSTHRVIKKPMPSCLRPFKAILNKLKF
jgi:hypothetical protein